MWAGHHPELSLLESSRKKTINVIFLEKYKQLSWSEISQIKIKCSTMMWRKRGFYFLSRSGGSAGFLCLRPPRPRSSASARGLWLGSRPSACPPPPSASPSPASPSPSYLGKRRRRSEPETQRRRVCVLQVAWGTEAALSAADLWLLCEPLQHREAFCQISTTFSSHVATFLNTLLQKRWGDFWKNLRNVVKHLCF